MNGPRYTPEFFKSEIEAAELELTQAISNERRVQLQAKIAVSRSYLENPDVTLKA
jgi:hypothetical protein